METGFAGMSAAVISPMLITFLEMEPYTAVGIALGYLIYFSVLFVCLRLQSPA